MGNAALSGGAAEAGRPRIRGARACTTMGFVPSASTVSSHACSRAIPRPRRAASQAGGMKPVDRPSRGASAGDAADRAPPRCAISCARTMSRCSEVQVARCRAGRKMVGRKTPAAIGVATAGLEKPRRSSKSPSRADRTRAARSQSGSISVSAEPARRPTRSSDRINAPTAPDTPVSHVTRSASPVWTTFRTSNERPRFAWPPGFRLGSGIRVGATTVVVWCTGVRALDRPTAETGREASRVAVAAVHDCGTGTCTIGTGIAATTGSTSSPANAPVQKWWRAPAGARR